MALSDSAIKNAKPKAEQYKLHDEKGLFAIIRPTGGKLWRFKYRYQGKEQQLSLGTYPEVSLKDARKRLNEARNLLAEGKDPGAEKKRAAVAASISAGNTFKVVAEEFIDKQKREGRAEATLAKSRWHLDRLDKLHSRPIADLPPSEWPYFYFRNGHEGGMEWQGSTSRKTSSGSCVRRRSC